MNRLFGYLTIILTDLQGCKKWLGQIRDRFLPRNNKVVLPPSYLKMVECGSDFNFFLGFELHARPRLNRRRTDSIYRVPRIADMTIVDNRPFFQGQHPTILPLVRGDF